MGKEMGESGGGEVIDGVGERRENGSLTLSMFAKTNRKRLCDWGHSRG